MMKSPVTRIFKYILFILSAYGLIFIVYILNHAIYLKTLPRPKEISGKIQFAWLQLRTPSYQNLQEVAQGKIPPQRIKTYLAFYRDILPYARNKGDVYQLMGYCYFYLKDYDRALESYRKAYNQNHQVFWFAHNLGGLLLREGRYQEAEKYLFRAQSIEPKFSLSFMMDYMRSFPLLVIYREIDVDTLSSRMISGLADNARMLVLNYYHLHEYDNMLIILNKIFNGKLPNKDIFNFYTGIAFYQLKKYPQAVKYFNKFIAMQKDSPDGNFYLGLALKKMGLKKEAEKFLRKAEVLQKQNPFRLLETGNLEVVFF